MAAVKNSGEDVWQWPEFIALANRMGIELRHKTVSATITIPAGGIVTFTQTFYANDQQGDDQQWREPEIIRSAS